ncbi:membrane-spanning 4-domains subfamily A member 4A-like [Trichomycterus rosablanca]|uniref:membrane-spanning 4-domains subfamily A member 4A-like n=1 Tax=Trichomycterus rosablanca TaxID=2290929 RepID=UPI002F351FA8
MSTSTVANTNSGFVVVTYVNSPPVAPAGSSNVGNKHVSPILKFLKGQPKALGVVQIMIGIVTFLFGIVMAVGNKYVSVPVISGIVYWASLIYIIAGSLSVAAESKLHSCVVKGSLGMNVVSAIVATPTIIILSTDCLVQLLNECCSSEDVVSYNFFLSFFFYCYTIYQMVLVGTDGVLAVLSFVQFIISICISAFACKATCCIEPEVRISAPSVYL